MSGEEEPVGWLRRVFRATDRALPLYTKEDVDWYDDRWTYWMGRALAAERALAEAQSSRNQ